MSLGQYGPGSLGVTSPNSLGNITINQLLGNRNDEMDAETLWARIAHLYLAMHHVARIFPEASNLDVVLTSGGAANTWGGWAEIVDTAATTFSSRFTEDGHLTAIMPEGANIANQIYMMEIVAGATRRVIARMRVSSGAVAVLPDVSQQRIRSLCIRAGETVYYRMMDETGGATLNVSIRYYLC